MSVQAGWTDRAGAGGGVSGTAECECQAPPAGRNT